MLLGGLKRCFKIFVGWLVLGFFFSHHQEQPRRGRGSREVPGAALLGRRAAHGLRGGGRLGVAVPLGFLAGAPGPSPGACPDRMPVGPKPGSDPVTEVSGS